MATLTPPPPAAGGTGVSAGIGGWAGTGPTGPLAPGTTLGNRYHIIRLLGVGGMGAVFQAWDDSLGVAVAIKVIRPEAGTDAGAARDLERRFKRELLLARQVTHRNVVRIHDLGEVDGITYITMPYVQGADLATILAREGRLSVRRALAVARQAVAGLQAAHEAGVVHRDLKPANIMIDTDDNALIMDFGIARSVAGGAGRTMAGAVVGTLEYMAPEQAMARPVDHRADLYSFGLILRDMVVGRREMARAESAVAELMQRIQQPLPPIRSHDPSLPEALEQIVGRCLQPDPGARYQTTADLAAALAALDADGHALASEPSTSGPAPISHGQPFAVPLPQGAASAPARAPSAAAAMPVAGRRRVPWTLAVGAIALLLTAGALGVYRLASPGRDLADAEAGKTTSLAIVPFRNASGDASLDWIGQSLAEMVKTELGDSPRLRVVSSERLFQILRDLRVSAETELDARTLRRLADFSNAERLLSGQYARFGAAIRIDASLQTPSGGGPILLRAEAATESDLPRAVRTLVESVQSSLALSRGPARADAGGTLTPTSSSVPALKAYSEAIQLSRHGNHLEALKAFTSATEADPQFALAHSRLSQTYALLGYDKEAEQASRRAVELSDKLTAAERSRVIAAHARVINDNRKAIDAYRDVLKIAPDDSQIRFDLAGLYEATGAYDQARDEFAKVLEQDPKYGDALFAMGRVEIRRRNPQGALDYLNRALSLAIQTENEQAKGTALNAIGVAYKRLNKPEDALRYYEEALEIRRRLDDKRGVAATLGEIGMVQDALSRFDPALASSLEAIQIQREIGDRRGVGLTLLNLGWIRERRGEYGEALALYKESLQIQFEIGNENYQALCLNNIGNVHLQRGDYNEALTYYERALQLREKTNVGTEIADTLHNIGETLSKTGQYDRALSQYLRALELRRAAGDRHGAAIESIGLGALFELQGRYGAALDARQEALQTLKGTRDDERLAEALTGYASSLVLLGRSREARRHLEEALEVARALKNPRFEAQTLTVRGDSYYHEGDVKSARPLYERALQVSTRASDQEGILRSRLDLAKLDVEEGRERAAVPRLSEIADKAGALRLQSVAAEAALYQGQALLATKQAVGARLELESAVNLGEQLGLREIATRAHFLLSRAFRQERDEARASRHLAEAGRLLQEMRKEARTDDLLRRSDLSPIVAATGSS